MPKSPGGKREGEGSQTLGREKRSGFVDVGSPSLLFCITEGASRRWFM